MKSFKRFYTKLNHIIEEAGLSISVLENPHGKTGESRVEIFKKKVKNNEPFEMVDGSEFVITDTKKAIIDIDNLKNIGRSLFVTGYYVQNEEEIVTILSSKIKKSNEFGGGSGSGKGEPNTALNESAQCYYCAAVCRILKGEGTFENITPDVLKMASRYVESTISVDDVIRDFSLKEWINSSILIANKLYVNKYITSESIFYRGKGLMTDIYNTNKKLLNDIGIKIQPNKWNPADIWVANVSPSTLNLLNAKTHIALNKRIKELYLSRELIPISLKFSKGTAKIVEYNLGSFSTREKATLIDFKMLSTSLYKVISIIGTYSTGTFDIRTSSHLKGMRIEILDKLTRGGNLAYGQINDLLKAYKVPKLPELSTIKAKMKKIDKKFIMNDFFNLFVKLGGPAAIGNNKIKATEFYNDVKIRMSVNAKGPNWGFSKYSAMCVIDRLLNYGNKSIEAFDDVIKMASSQGSYSSVFIKIN